MIRPLAIGDAEAHLAGEDAEQARWLSGGKSNLEGTRAWIEQTQRLWDTERSRVTFGVWECTDHSLVGMVEANLGQRFDGVPSYAANISYGLHAGARGKGYMDRALKLLIDFLIQRDVLLMVIRVDPGNTASLRVPERNGFTYIETITSCQSEILTIWYRKI
jgi:RimJ/RimL family protein N-acetyltransferase